MNLLNKLGKLAKWQKITASVLSICLVGTVSAGVILTSLNKNEEVVDEPSTIETSGIEEAPPALDTVSYSFLGISIDSMEKDINVYFTDEAGAKIKGQNFSVKLVSLDDTKKLDEAKEKIVEITKQVDASKDLPAVNEKKDGEEFSSIEQLYRQKTDAIGEYTELLKSVNGDTLTDDDADGLIYKKDLEPGEFMLCYVPVASYEPKDYLVKTKIKDKIEYKKVENIEKKVEKYNAAADGQSGAETPIEEKKANTVNYVASATKDIPAVYAETTAVLPTAATSGTNSVKLNKIVEGMVDEAGGGFESNINVSSVANVLLYSNVANSADITLQISGGSFGDVTPNCSSGINAQLISNNASSRSYRISANSEADISGYVDFVVSSTVGSTTYGNTLRCNVSVIGSKTQLKDSAGRVLFKDSEGKVALTYGNYSSGTKAYYMAEAPSTSYYGWQVFNGIRYYYDENGKRVTGEQVIEGMEYKFGTDGALLTSGYGIDVSKWQGDIDWSQVRSVASFAIIRAGTRGRNGEPRTLQEDPYAGINIKGATSNGIKVGLYYYSTALTEAEAVEEASHAIAIAQKYGAGKISLPIYIDMENAVQLELSQQERNNIVLAFCKTVKASGYSAGVYANKNWYTHYLNPETYPGWISIWYARYNSFAGYDGRYDIWQYSSDGSVPGINTRVDMDIAYF